MIGKKISELLKIRGMKQTELARITGVSKTTINSIITRNNKNVDFSTMEKIADALDVPIEYFFDRNGDGPKIKPIISEGLSEMEERFVNAFTALTPTNRHTLIIIAEALLRDQASNAD